jgi:hypothetical protein
VDKLLVACFFLHRRKLSVVEVVGKCRDGHRRMPCSALDGDDSMSVFHVSGKVLIE